MPARQLRCSLPNLGLSCWSSVQCISVIWSFSADCVTARCYLRRRHQSFQMAAQSSTNHKLRCLIKLERYGNWEFRQGNIMSHLTVLYDERCSLCCRITDWILLQPKYVQLNFIPANSAEARSIFPQLDHERTLRELHVITGNGEIYRAAKAWLMCLWALREYRSWSLRLATSEMMPLARRVIVRVSISRGKLARYASFLPR